MLTNIPLEKGSRGRDRSLAVSRRMVKNSGEGNIHRLDCKNIQKRKLLAILLGTMKEAHFDLKARTRPLLRNS